MVCAFISDALFDEVVPQTCAFEVELAPLRPLYAVTAVTNDLSMRSCSDQSVCRTSLDGVHTQLHLMQLCGVEMNQQLQVLTAEDLECVDAAVASAEYLNHLMSAHRLHGAEMHCVRSVHLLSCVCAAVAAIRRHQSASQARAMCADAVVCVSIALMASMSPVHWKRLCGAFVPQEFVMATSDAIQSVAAFFGIPVTPLTADTTPAHSDAETCMDVSWLSTLIDPSAAIAAASSLSIDMLHQSLQVLS